MWNLEIDDEDAQSEDFVKSAMESVLAALVEVRKPKSFFSCFFF